MFNLWASSGFLIPGQGIYLHHCIFKIIGILHIHDNLCPTQSDFSLSYEQCLSKVSFPEHFCILFHIQCSNAEFSTVMMACFSWIPTLAFPIVPKCAVPYLCAITVSELREFQSTFLWTICILSKSPFPKLKKKPSSFLFMSRTFSWPFQIK